MASLVLGIAGAAALGPAGLVWGGALGMSGAQIGFIAGSSLGSMLFAPNMPDVQGPRMADLKVQASTYGAPIPIYYGTARGAGQVIWSSDLIETSHEEEAGGKGGPSQSVTTYTYSVNCAVGICEGEITGIRKIWANGDLIYDQSLGNMGPTGQSSNIRVYTGSETQVADSLIESYVGTGNAPAHRGMAYVVFENFQLEKYGNRIPNFSFEVVAAGDVTTPDHAKLSSYSIRHIMPHPFIDGIYLATSRDDGDAAPNIYLHIIDPIAGTDRAIAIDVGVATNSSGFMTYVDYGTDPITGLPLPMNEIWVCSNNGYEYAIAFDATTLELKRRIVTDTLMGYNLIGKCVFDKSNQKVLFATSGSTISAGCRYLDPVSLTWGTGFTVTGTNWFTAYGATGENSICLVDYNNNAVFFSDGVRSIQSTGVTTLQDGFMAYDSTRNRYACFSRNVSSQAVFRTFKDNSTFELEDISTTVTGVDYEGTLDYWKNVDKYIYRNNGTIKILNADTFALEQSYTKSIGDELKRSNLEIAGMPEYFIGHVTIPSNGAALIPLTDRLDANPVALSSIVTDICRRVDLAAGDIDVTGLTDDVAGYTIAQQMSARAALDGLQAAFFFDAVESD